MTSRHLVQVQGVPPHTPHLTYHNHHHYHSTTHPSAHLHSLLVSPCLHKVTGGINLRCWEPDAREGCTLGPISRDGWAVYDDAATARVDPKTRWWSAPAVNAADLYFFGHGLDYQGALRDFVSVAGPMPEIPRFVLGVWWSRCMPPPPPHHHHHLHHHYHHHYHHHTTTHTNTHTHTTPHQHDLLIAIAATVEDSHEPTPTPTLTLPLILQYHTLTPTATLTSPHPHPCPHSHAPVCNHALIPTHTHTSALTRTPTHMHTHTHAHTHAHTHTHVHTHAPIHARRYWPYTAEDLLEIAAGYASRSIPIDVLVSDMAW
jgi:hypothetical protein